MSLNIDLGYELHQMDHWNDSVPFDHQLIPKWSLLHLDYVEYLVHFWELYNFNAPEKL